MRNSYVIRILAAAAVIGMLAGCQGPKAGDAAAVESTAGATQIAASPAAEKAEAAGTKAESGGADRSQAADSRIAAASEMAAVESVVEDWMVPVTVDSLVEGTYPVTVASSSSMFSIVSAELTVNGDHMYAALKMKGTGYQYLFMGTPEEAVGAGEKEYLPFAENADGSHTFTIPVVALDQGFDCAAFSKRKEKWYARTLVARSDSLPASAFKKEALTTAVDLGLSDGTYTIDVSLSGGSGRASLKSPASLRIEGDSAVATIVWSSSNYDYMIVDGQKYEPVSVENGAVFEIPVVCFDRPMRVIGDTTAMSKPYEIEYVLVFASETIQ